MNDFTAFYNEFLRQLELARKSNNSSDFQKLLKVVEPEWKLEEQELYVGYCIHKAGIYALFGESIDLDDWMQKALQFSDHELLTDVYAKWINLYWSLAKAVRDQSKITAIFSSLYNISTKALKLEMGKFDRYSFISIRAFSLAALGKHSELEEYLSSIKWNEIPVKLFNDKTKLGHLYTHLYKLLISALEIRDEKILNEILKMVSIDDGIIMSKSPLFRKFNTVVMDLSDLRPEFAADFNSFYKLRKKWAGYLPNFSLFTMMIEEENSKGLDLFFKGMEN